MFENRALKSLNLDHKDWSRLFEDTVEGQIKNPCFILETLREKTEQGFKFTVFFPYYVRQNPVENKLKYFNSSDEECVAAFDKFCGGYRAVIECPDEVLKIDILGTVFNIESNLVERDVFAGKHAALLITNGENHEVVTQWIKFYKKEHNLRALVIFERVAPNSPELIIDEANLVIHHVKIDAPIGKIEPSAREVYMAPDAPGKEQMNIPSNNPWRSELNDNMLLEIARLAYLDDAQAVLNGQVSDLVIPAEKSIFEICDQSELGYIQLLGTRCFPWRVRKKDLASHGDHSSIMFNSPSANKSWCVNPARTRKGDIWNLFRIGKIPDDPKHIAPYWRMMGLRHEDPSDNNPNLAPKTALIGDDGLIEFVTKYCDGKPVSPPTPEKAEVQKASNSGRRLIVTTMKNEGPFLLEWIAYHKAIGFDDIVVFTNDCTDGTDHFFDLLHKKGIVEHRDNPYRELDMKPQHAALAEVKKSKLFKKADWVICMDVDEYVNIHVGDGTLDDLFKAVGDANMISMTWRLMGNSDVVEFEDKPIIEQFNRAAHDVTRFPHQAWGVKTLYRQTGFFKKMGVHRPKGLKPEYLNSINWVNGSGTKLPESFYRTAWRTGTATVGYDMVTLNHYAVRSMESFLVKRDRGRVNHVDRDQGLHYWFRMNHNVIEDNSIKRMIPKMREELDKLMADPEIAEFHHACVEAHRDKIAKLLETDAYKEFFALINSERLRELSHYTNKLGMNVYEVGEHVIPDETIKALRENQIDYFNVYSDGKPFT